MTATWGGGGPGRGRIRGAGGPSEGGEMTARGGGSGKENLSSLYPGLSSGPPEDSVELKLVTFT